MPISVPEPLIDIRGLEAGYGKIRVLHGIDLAIAPGEVVALLGPNGGGKTTFLRAVSGLLPWTGAVCFAGQDVNRHWIGTPDRRPKGTPLIGES